MLIEAIDSTSELPSNPGTHFGSQGSRSSKKILEVGGSRSGLGESASAKVPKDPSGSSGNPGTNDSNILALRSPVTKRNDRPDTPAHLYNKAQDGKR